MRTLLTAAAIALLTSACVQDKTPDAANSILQTDKEQVQLAVDLTTAHDEQNVKILAISRSSYNCGLPPGRQPPEPVDADTLNTAQAYKAALNVVVDYKEILDKIAGAATKAVTDEQDSRMQLEKDIDNFGNVVPPAALYTAAAKAAIDDLGAVADLLNTATANSKMRAFAQTMQPILEAAAKVLESNYNVVDEKVAGAAFAKWDFCMKDSFYYIRDIATVGIHGYKAYVGPSSGTELAAAWESYKTQRAAFKARFKSAKDFKTIVEDLLKQNAALATSSAFDVQAILSAAGSIGAACQNFQKQLPAGQKVLRNDFSEVCPVPPAATPTAATPTQKS